MDALILTTFIHWATGLGLGKADQSLRQAYLGMKSLSIPYSTKTCDPYEDPM